MDGEIVRSVVHQACIQPAAIGWGGRKRSICGCHHAIVGGKKTADLDVPPCVSKRVEERRSVSSAIEVGAVVAVSRAGPSEQLFEFVVGSIQRANQSGRSSGFCGRDIFRPIVRRASRLTTVLPRTYRAALKNSFVGSLPYFLVVEVAGRLVGPACTSGRV